MGLELSWESARFASVRFEGSIPFKSTKTKQSFSQGWLFFYFIHIYFLSKRRNTHFKSINFLYKSVIDSILTG